MQYFQAQDTDLKMISPEPNLFPKSEVVESASLTSFTKVFTPRLLDINIRTCTLAYSLSYPATR